MSNPLDAAQALILKQVRAATEVLIFTHRFMANAGYEPAEACSLALGAASTLLAGGNAAGACYWIGIAHAVIQSAGHDVIGALATNDPQQKEQVN